MKAFRFFSDWDRALFVTKQRGGSLLRSNRGEGWVFFPKSGHLFDTLSDSEQAEIRRKGTMFNGKLCSYQEIRETVWNYYEDQVKALISEHPPADQSIEDKETRDYEMQPVDNNEDRFIDDNDYVWRDIEDDYYSFRDDWARKYGAVGRDDP